MKNLFTALCFVLAIQFTYGQAPQGINYQAVVRNSLGNVIVSSPVGMKVSIHQTTAGGTIVYSETFTPTTSAIGLVNLVIGQGTVLTGNFATINWTAGPYFCELGLDPTGGSTYTSMGTQQLMSVPYALYAENSGTAGPTGPAGANGATWFTGVGTPLVATGINNDLYLNTTNGDYYLKTGGLWILQANLTGPIGTTGATGPSGNNGATWFTGTGVPSAGTGIDNDLYLNTANGDYYLKISGAWTLQANLTGPTGPIGVTGTNGTNGATWFTGAGVPSAGIGVDNDLYLNTANGDYYLKISGTWTLQANLTGPIGPSWTINSVTYNSNGTVGIGTTIPSTITSTNSVWTTTGNTGTTVGTNYIGTNDAQAFVIKTNGTASTNERIRFMATPQIQVNRTTAQAGDLFAVYGTGTAGAINSIANQTDFPINGYSTGMFAGIYGENTGTGQGILGSNTSTGAGVYGINNNTGGFGVFAYNQAAGIALGALSTGGYAINASTNGALVSGIRGLNTNASGTGVIGLGNNIASATLSAGGSGVAGFGTAAGGYFIGTNAANGIGIFGGGSNNTGFMNTTQGEGVCGNGTNFGVAGFATGALANDRWGGYFDFSASANGYALVAGRTGGTDYTILGGGTKLTVIKDNQGQYRGLSCIESPEILFQDFGTGQLTNGKTHIKLDDVFSGSITVNEQHPLKVFIQLEGDCKGVYVTNKTSDGFDVIELDGGHSNVSFSYTVVGNRADTKDENGNVTSIYADWRLPVLPGRVNSITIPTGEPMQQVIDYKAPYTVKLPK